MRCMRGDHNRIREGREREMKKKREGKGNEMWADSIDSEECEEWAEAKRK